jgi:thiamine monophosphate kinase
VAGSGGGAGIDISDGLASDASRVAETSGVALLIDVAALPLHPLTSEAAPLLGVSPAAFAFGTGGEWQHLITVAPEALDGALAAGGILVGEVTDGPAGVYVTTRSGGRTAVAPLGHSDGVYAGFPEEICDLVRRAHRSLMSHV